MSSCSWFIARLPVFMLVSLNYNAIMSMCLNYSDIAHSNGFCVCPYFIGHGIGSYFHGHPEIWHHGKSFFLLWPTVVVLFTFSFFKMVVKSVGQLGLLEFLVPQKLPTWDVETRPRDKFSPGFLIW